MLQEMPNGTGTHHVSVMMTEHNVATAWLTLVGLHRRSRNEAPEALREGRSRNEATPRAVKIVELDTSNLP